jgi:superfamily II DNA/RNA helicase
MLDMGFINDVRKIVAMLPKDRQTMLFSATMPNAIADLAKRMLRDPVKVAVTPEAATADRVAQSVIHVDRSMKPTILADILKGAAVDRTLVFTRTKHGADKVVRGLVKAGIAAEAIHGNKSQNQRERVLAAFRKGTVRTLVATDIAARGIDVDGISHVVNFDIPNIPETYVHRIGRTARAGAEGIAISLCDGEERAFLRDIEKLIRMSIPASDQRGASRHAAPLDTVTHRDTPPHRDTRPRSPAPNKQSRRRRGARQNQDRREGHERRDQGHDRREPDRREAQPGSANGASGNGLAAVAFLHRDPQPSRNANKRWRP